MSKWFKKLKKDDGFTLIEMVIVIMIITMLLLLVVTNIDGVGNSVKKTTDEGIIQTVDTQKVLYKIETGNEADAEVLENKDYISKEQYDMYIEAIDRKKIEED